MLKSRDETVCWLASHPGAVLAVGEMIARVVDPDHHSDGVTMKTAHALMAPPHAAWFDVEPDGRRKRLRLNAAGAVYHAKLVEKRRCRCPRPRAA